MESYNKISDEIFNLLNKMQGDDVEREREEEEEEEVVDEAEEQQSSMVEEEKDEAFEWVTDFILLFPKGESLLISKDSLMATTSIIDLKKIACQQMKKEKTMPKYLTFSDFHLKFEGLKLEDEWQVDSFKQQKDQPHELNVFFVNKIVRGGGGGGGGVGDSFQSLQGLEGLEEIISPIGDEGWTNRSKKSIDDYSPAPSYFSGGEPKRNRVSMPVHTAYYESRAGDFSGAASGVGGLESAFPLACEVTEEMFVNKLRPEEACFHEILELAFGPHVAVTGTEYFNKKHQAAEMGGPAVDLQFDIAVSYMELTQQRLNTL